MMHAVLCYKVIVQIYWGKNVVLKFIEKNTWRSQIFWKTFEKTF